MNWLARIIVRNRRVVVIIFGILAMICAFLIPFVGINYDLSLYLPRDSNTRQSMEVVDKEFSLTSYAQVMLGDVDIPMALSVKKELQSIKGIKNVLWLDDLVDIYQPLDLYPNGVVENYYKDGYALFQIEFSDDQYSLGVGEAIDEIQGLSLIRDKGMLRGAAIRSKVVRESTLREVFSITVFVIPIFLLILVLTTTSWFEPVVYLLVIGTSVIINMGTNIIFGQISFITISSAAVLQLALSMDYSLFLLHRFTEEKDKGLSSSEAMVKAICGSFSSLAASCLTTVAGFLALMFMRFTIGKDMSLVLGKGIIISLISVIFLLPCVTIFFNKILEKTEHKSFLPSLTGVSKGIFKVKIPILVLIALISVPAFLAQKSNTFVYGESAITDDENNIVGIHEREIDKIFGVDNPLVLVVPTEGSGKEKKFTDELLSKSYMVSVQGLTTLADPFIPKAMLPKRLLDNFLSKGYTRFILGLDVPVESEETFLAIEDLKALVESYYEDEYYLLGSSASVGEIKALVDKDFFIVDMISIVAVLFIMFITFRSFTIPFLLVLVIKSAIWVNMAVPYFMGTSLSFVGYMIVSAVQLGATIDYAILLTNRYLEYRKCMEKKKAMEYSIKTAGWPIITSALILFAAGMGVYIISSVGEVSEMGLLIGRGALLSGGMVFLVLPHILVIFDGLIVKTTYGLNSKAWERGL